MCTEGLPFFPQMFFLLSCLCQNFLMFLWDLHVCVFKKMLLTSSIPLRRIHICREVLHVDDLCAQWCEPYTLVWGFLSHFVFIHLDFSIICSFNSRLLWAICVIKVQSHCHPPPPPPPPPSQKRMGTVFTLYLNFETSHGVRAFELCLYCL